MNNFIKIYVTGFFIGYIKFAPGSFASIFGFLIAVILSNNFIIYLLISIIILITGIIFSSIAETKIFKEKDSSKIVIDEILGSLVAYFLFPSYNLISITLLFILFRLFDILKPFPIKIIEKLPKGFGIMLDDILAGIYASITIDLIYYFYNYLEKS